MDEIGRKDDGTTTGNPKPRASLFPANVYWEVVRVLEFGARKYAPDNWRRVDQARTRYYDAARRHLDKWWQGQEVDPDSGDDKLYHLACAICSLVFLLAFDLDRKEPK